MAEDKKSRSSSRRLMDSEGGFITFLSKTGETLILGVLWIVTSLGIITIGSSWASMYYAIVKSVRKGRGYPVKEFFSSFKRTFGKGATMSIVLAMIVFAIVMLCRAAVSMQSTQGNFLLRTYFALGAAVAAIVIYLFPVLSRFTMSIGEMVRLAFIMCFRYIYFTVIILGGTAGIIYMYLTFLPLITLLVIPAAWFFVCTLMIEKVLRHYMPKPDETNKDEWYYK